MKNLKFRTLVAITLVLLLTLQACGGGSSDSDDNDSNNEASACSAFKVINGQECQSENLPVVLVELTSASGSFICTGTIVGKDHVLTAAHCLSDQLIGARIFHDRAQLDAVEYSIHPLFLQTAGSAQYDLGVLAVPNVANDAAVTPAPLAAAQQLNIGQILQLIGYGVTEDGDFGRDLPGGNPRATDLQVANYDGQVIYTLYDQTKTNACFGDSGAAAVVAGKIVGVVASGTADDCLDGDVNLFTSVMSDSSKAYLNEVIPDVRFE